MNTKIPLDLIDIGAASQIIPQSAATIATARHRIRLEIPHYKIGRLVRFSRRELEDWVAARAVPGIEKKGGQV